MKKIIMPLFLLGLFFGSCSNDDLDVPKVEEPEKANLEIERFIYKAMAEWYLYEADVPKLQEGFFKDTKAKDDYLASFDSPEDLFNDLQSDEDRFSFMWDDYAELENMLYSGVEKTNGMIYGLGRITGTDNVFGIVRYILPNSSAEAQGVKRGDAFMEVNGQQLNLDNYRKLLDLDNYSLSLAEIKSGSIGGTGISVDLVQEERAENPVFITQVLKVEGIKIGYLMYNGFTLDFDAQLNAAFAELKSAGIDELVLDLRYNSGGSIETAVDLSSMITGQFEGKILAQNKLNEKWQAIYEQQAPEALKYRFNDKIRTGELINKLNLSKVYVIALSSSASASELVINGLAPYIDVVHIGQPTAGKFQGSRTLYDSSTSEFFEKVNVNKNHTYAIQPLIMKVANANGRSDYGDGLTPDIAILEKLDAYGVLGDVNEPLLKAAINAILGKPQDQDMANAKRMEQAFKIIGESKMFNPTHQKMYDNNFPILDKE